MHSARAIANSFLKIANQEKKQLTNMQLQKLVYFAHGWHLALTGEPLLADTVKAWNFGPVIPPLYNSLRMYGNGQVTEPIKRKNTDTGEISVIEEPLSQYEQQLLQRIWQVYGHMSGSELSYLSHEPGSPWEAVWKKEKFGLIPDDLIQEHFLTLKSEKHGE